MLVLVVMIPVHMFSFSKTDTESTSPGERASLKEALYRERQTGSWLREQKTSSDLSGTCVQLRSCPVGGVRVVGKDQ